MVILSLYFHVKSGKGTPVSFAVYATRIGKRAMRIVPIGDDSMATPYTFDLNRSSGG